MKFRIRETIEFTIEADSKSQAKCRASDKIKVLANAGVITSLRTLDRRVAQLFDCTKCGKKACTTGKDSRCWDCIDLREDEAEFYRKQGDLHIQ